MDKIKYYIYAKWNGEKTLLRNRLCKVDYLKFTKRDMKIT